VSTTTPVEPVGRMHGTIKWVTVAVLTVVGVVPIVGNWLRVQDVDPQFMRNLIERVHQLGGTFYENGIYNKGPLEPVVYSFARHIGGYDGMWFVISALSALVALVCGLAAARTAAFVRAPAGLRLAAGAALYVHLTVSPSDYAGVLYARNMTIGLLAALWIVMLSDECWSSPRRQLASSIALGAVLGIVVQALLAQVFTAAAVGLAVVVFRFDAGMVQRRRNLGAAAVSAAGAFLLAPLWYLLRGAFSEYWVSWYTDARLMTVGTERSLGSQLALGWDKGFAYYQQRPLGFIVVLAFAFFTYATWNSGSRRDRAVGLGLLGWFAASWLEQVLNQRYSSHYFIINTVPTALMAVVLVGRLAAACMRDERVLRTAVAMPLVAVLGTVYLGGTKEFRSAVERTSSFRGVRANAQDVADNQAGNVRSVRGVLDLVSHDGDAILTWTNEAAPYLDVHRIAAGRFMWKSFLMGEIYLGKSGPRYLLPHTWEWFARDVARTRPVAFFRLNDDPAPGTPFARLIDTRFQLAFNGNRKVYLRHDVAEELIENSARRPWTPRVESGPTGWTVDEGSASYISRSTPGESDPLVVRRNNCFRLEGSVAGVNEAPAFDIRFEPNPGARFDMRREPLHLRLDGDSASSASDATVYETAPAGAGQGQVGFTLVVGRRAAALIIGGQVRAALRIPSSSTVSIRSLRTALDLSNLRIGPAPARSGCAADS
jgi:hypothetical protein